MPRNNHQIPQLGHDNLSNSINDRILENNAEYIEFAQGL